MSNKHRTFVIQAVYVLQEGAGENVVILLLGNKSDHASRQVTTAEGQILAEVLDRWRQLLSSSSKYLLSVGFLFCIFCSSTRWISWSVVLLQVTT